MGGVIGGVLIIALLAFFLVRRRRRQQRWPPTIPSKELGAEPEVFSAKSTGFTSPLAQDPEAGHGLSWKTDDDRSANITEVIKAPSAVRHQPWVPLQNHHNLLCLSIKAILPLFLTYFAESRPQFEFCRE